MTTVTEAWPNTADNDIDYQGDLRWVAYGDTNPTVHGVRVVTPGELVLLFNALIIVEDVDLGRWQTIRVTRYGGGSSTTRSGIVGGFSGTGLANSTFYRFDHRHSDGSTRLMRSVNGATEHIATQASFPVSYPAVLELRIRPGDGDAAVIEGWIDGQVRMSAVDPDPFVGTRGGMVGSLGGGSDTFWGAWEADVGDPDPDPDPPSDGLLVATPTGWKPLRYGAELDR